MWQAGNAVRQMLRIALKFSYHPAVFSFSESESERVPLTYLKPQSLDKGRQSG